MIGPAPKPDWGREGPNWPHAAHSRFEEAAGIRWHVQIMGQGPVALLIHGTGAGGHSWRDIMPLLAERFTLVVPDLPGHAFTGTPRSDKMSLPGMARGLLALLDRLDLAPEMIVGHSAGAAIAFTMVRQSAKPPKALISFNGALLPFEGVAGWLFSPLAKVLSFNPLLPRYVAYQAGSLSAVDRYIRSTGSTLDAEGVRLYHRLARCPGHIAAILTMMAHWDLEPLQNQLAAIPAPVLLVAGEQDRAVPAADADKVAAKLARARTIIQPGLGHLSHEERPEEAARLILEHWCAVSVNQ